MVKSIAGDLRMPILHRTFPAELDVAIANARKLHEVAWNSGPEKGAPNTSRMHTLSGFVTVLFEHHDSTLRLLETGSNDASAFAMARILLETFYRGFWMYLCASDAQVDKIRSGGEPYPIFMEMTKQVDQALRGTGKFQLGKGILRSLNGFIHTGFEQLTRRFNDEGNLVPSYPLSEVLLVLSSGTMLLSVMSQFFCLKAGRGADGKQINECWKTLFGEE
jgi:hypothetical protein